MMSKICWITAIYMLQVELPILSELKKKYQIDWYVWGDRKSESGKVAEKYASDHGITLRFIESPYIDLDPRSYGFCNRVIRNMRNDEYDAYYFDISTFPWLLMSIKRYLDPSKVIIAMHHGKIHSGMRFKLIYRPFLKYLNGRDFYLQYFSNIQSEAFTGKDENKRYVIPLALNDFGRPNRNPDNDVVIFTAFGNIINTKNIPLLIEAGNRLWEEMSGRFKIRIVGRGKFWDSNCRSLIRHPEAFELDIRRIAEEEIPNLFATSHYMVFPYKAVTQSGPLRIAYGYNVPVIASDLDGFKESVEEGITGILFKSEDVDSLIGVMRDAINNHPDQYNRIKHRQAEYVDRNLSTESVCAKYEEMLDKVLNNEN